MYMTIILESIYIKQHIFNMSYVFYATKLTNMIQCAFLKINKRRGQRKIIYCTEILPFKKN